MGITGRNLEDRIQDTRVILGLYMDATMQMLTDDAGLSREQAAMSVRTWIARYWDDKGFAVPSDSPADDLIRRLLP